MVTVPTTICLLFRIPETHKVLLSPRKESLEENMFLMQVMEHLVWKQSPVRPFLWASQTFNLQGLDTSARYLVKFPSDNEKQYSGEELANPGLSIHLPEAESSIIITYKVAM
jgi:hypothetical protein